MGRKRPSAIYDPNSSEFTIEELRQTITRLSHLTQPLIARSQDYDAHTPRKHIGEGWYQVDQEVITDIDILYIRAKIMSHNLDSQLDLPPAFPSSPTRPPRFGFHFFANREFLGYHTFYSAYAAARFILTIIDDQPYKWSADNEIEVDNGVTIKAEHFTDLEQVITHKDNAVERQWELPTPYTAYARRIISHRPLDRIIAADIDTDNGEPIKRERVIALKREKTPPAAPKARSKDLSGITTLADIAQTLLLDPRHCRAALRKSNRPKPTDGWQWSTQDAIDDVTEFLKENVK